MEFEKNLKIFLSGGSQNKNPKLSLGGECSVYRIENLKNIFPHSKEIQNKIYRCIYLENDNHETLYDLNVYCECSENLDCEIGTITKNEMQSIFLPNKFNEFNLTYDRIIDKINFSQTTKSISFNDNIEEKLKIYLNELYLLGEINVTIDKDRFIVEFDGGEKNRRQNILISNNKEIKIEKIVNGSPINSFSHKIRFENQTPNGINFKKDLSIGDLDFGDKFYIWISKAIKYYSEKPEWIKIKTRSWTRHE